MTDNSTSTAVSPAKLAHLVFRTPRYEAMVKWYSTVLNAAPVFADAMLTFLTYDEEHHREAITSRPAMMQGVARQVQSGG